MRHFSAPSWLAALLACVLLFGAGGVAADARTDYLIRILQTSEEFRVRAQAAIALGGMSPSDPVVQALVRGLADADPSVRAACAASLERVGDASALAALRTAAADAQANVRSAATRAQRAIETRTRSASTTTTTTTTTTTVASSTNTTPSASDRYYVGVNALAASAQGLDPTVLRSARQLLVREVSGVSGVVIAPEGESSGAANTAIRSRRLTGFFLDASVVEFESTAAGTRVKISVIVGTYPGRDMRAILQGSATVPGAQGVEAQRMAVEGAIRGALRQLGSAFARSAPSRP